MIIIDFLILVLSTIDPVTNDYVSGIEGGEV